MGALADRRQLSKKRITELKAEIAQSKGICGDVACVYATGSFGRGEAGEHSDLDLFIAGKCYEKGGIRERALSRLNEIVVKADLIAATRKLKFPEFSGDGEYLKHYTIEELVQTLGQREDDVKNTFTARLLLLLESQVLVGDSAYRYANEEVVEAYWRDYQDHKVDFMPAFLANDILRMWRTFCVNYEASTKTEPEEKKIKRKLKNYKLKHSRMLTCYSALLFLAAKYAQARTVSPDDVVTMISLTPTERIEWLLDQEYFKTSHQNLRELIERYENFLESTNASEQQLIERFRDKDQSRKFLADAYAFGDVIFNVLESIDKESRFHRLLLV